MLQNMNNAVNNDSSSKFEEFELFTDLEDFNYTEEFVCSESAYIKKELKMETPAHSVMS